MFARPQLPVSGTNNGADPRASLRSLPSFTGNYVTMPAIAATPLPVGAGDLLLSVHVFQQNVTPRENTKVMSVLFRNPEQCDVTFRRPGSTTVTRSHVVPQVSYCACVIPVYNPISS